MCFSVRVISYNSNVTLASMHQGTEEGILLPTKLAILAAGLAPLSLLEHRPCYFCYFKRGKAVPANSTGMAHVHSPVAEAFVFAKNLAWRQSCKRQLVLCNLCRGARLLGPGALEIPGTFWRK